MGGKVIGGMPPIVAIPDAKAGADIASSAAESRIFLIISSPMPIRREANENFFWSGRRPAGYHPDMAATLAESTGFFAGRRAVADAAVEVAGAVAGAAGGSGNLMRLDSGPHSIF